jgi:hypothetical protein
MMVPAPGSAGYGAVAATDRTTAVASSPLVHGTHLVGGVHVDIDLMAPCRWDGVSYAPDVATIPLLSALIADEVPHRIAARGSAYRPSIKLPATDAAPSAAPWLRVAVVDALDRWLQAPLVQALIDAERGVVRGRAARTLPPGPARAVLTGDAVRLARRASRDFTAFLRRVARYSTPVRESLCSALTELVDGYSELAEEVAGPDRELKAVVDGWRRLSRRPRGASRHPAAHPPSRALPGRPHSVIDPRQVRARVLAMSADPTSPEVTMQPHQDAVVVRVPACGPAVDPDLASRLLVRLVDRRTATPRAYAILRAAGAHAGDQTFFEATLPLCGQDVADVQADVVDALSDLDPAPDDTDDGLHEARCAVMFLAEWRRLVGGAQLGVVAAAPARRLRDLASCLQPNRARVADPLFRGGPSRAELETLADLGDEELLRRLRGDGPISAGLRALTAGAAGLLVAEAVALLVAPVG